VILFEGDPKNLASPFTFTNMARAVNIPAEQSYQRFEQNTQVMVQEEQRMQEQRLAEQQSQGRGMSR
jgi:hypothetical protein